MKENLNQILEENRDKPIYINTKDFLVTGESFSLIYNKSLDLLQTNPIPTPHRLSDYYKSSEYISHTDRKKGIIEFLYRIVKSFSVKRKINWIEKKINSKGSVLDIGAGTGDFLLEAKKRGWMVMGTEPNALARDLAKSKEIILKENLDEIKEKFDVITLWHVLEHIPDLEKTINRLSSLIKPNGLLIVAVPNFKSYDAKYYGKFWAAYDVPRHIWHFSKKAIEELFRSDFELKEIKPLLFDSYYVSLLSEKYKFGKKISLKAFFIGWKSNFRAKRSGEYSSLIYCLKKRG